MTASEARIRNAARIYHQNVRDLQTGKSTVDEHRATNREIRSNLTDTEWERAKATALNQI